MIVINFLILTLPLQYALAYFITSVSLNSLRQVKLFFKCCYRYWTFFFIYSEAIGQISIKIGLFSSVSIKYLLKFIDQVPKLCDAKRVTLLSIHMIAVAQNNYYLLWCISIKQCQHLTDNLLLFMKVKWPLKHILIRRDEKLEHEFYWFGRFNFQSILFCVLQQWIFRAFSFGGTNQNKWNSMWNSRVSSFF